MSAHKTQLKGHSDPGSNVFRLNAPKLFRPRVPLFLRGVAACVTLAPFVNFWLSYNAFRFPDNPRAFSLFISLITPLDWFRLGLTLMAGPALLWPRKSSWLLATAALLLAIGMSVSDIVYSKSHQPVFLFLISSIAVASVLWFFRFPYLDRRDTWWGLSERFGMDTPGEYRPKSSPLWSRGQISNISRSGVVISGPLAAQPGERFEVQLGLKEDRPLVLDALVIRTTGNKLGMQFAFSSLKERLRLGRWIRTALVQNKLIRFNDRAKLV